MADVSLHTGVYIRALRKKAGLTQGQLATAAGLSRDTIVRAESGKPVARETFRRLANVLHPLVEFQNETQSVVKTIPKGSRGDTERAGVPSELGKSAGSSDQAGEPAGPLEDSEMMQTLEDMVRAKLNRRQFQRWCLEAYELANQIANSPEGLPRSDRGRRPG